MWNIIHQIKGKVERERKRIMRNIRYYMIMIENKVPYYSAVRFISSTDKNIFQWKKSNIDILYCYFFSRCSLLLNTICYCSLLLRDNVVWSRIIIVPYKPVLNGRKCRVFDLRAIFIFFFYIFFWFFLILTFL